MPLFSGQHKFLRAFNNILLAGKIAGGLAAAGAGVYGLYKGGEALVDQLRSKINQIGFPPQWAKDLIEPEPKLLLSETSHDTNTLFASQAEGEIELADLTPTEKEFRMSDLTPNRLKKKDYKKYEDVLAGTREELRLNRDVAKLTALYEKGYRGHLTKRDEPKLKELEKKLKAPGVYEKVYTRVKDPLTVRGYKTVELKMEGKLNDKQREQLDRAEIDYLGTLILSNEASKADEKRLKVVEARVNARAENTPHQTMTRQMEKVGYNAAIKHKKRADNLANSNTFGRGDQPQRGVEEGIQEEADALRDIRNAPEDVALEALYAPQERKAAEKQREKDKAEMAKELIKLQEEHQMLEGATILSPPKMSAPNKLSVANTFGTGVGAGVGGLPQREKPAKPGPGGAPGYGDQELTAVEIIEKVTDPRKKKDLIFNYLQKQAESYYKRIAPSYPDIAKISNLRLNAAANYVVREYEERGGDIMGLVYDMTEFFKLLRLELGLIKRK